jgi:hypothetical protein
MVSTSGFRGRCASFTPQGDGAAREIRTLNLTDLGAAALPLSYSRMVAWEELNAPFHPKVRAVTAPHAMTFTLPQATP